VPSARRSGVEAAVDGERRAGDEGCVRAGEEGDSGRERDRACVASAAVLERLTLPAGIAADPLGDIQLRGKSETLPVFALERKGAAA
jgi:class 3 adenylate cyclase